METREHKYRAWDKPSKKHFYENENTKIYLYGNGKWDFCSGQEWLDTKVVYWGETDDLNGILQQWTGLQSKDNKDIYEGDIITFGGEWDENGLVVRNPTVKYYEVIWLHGGFQAVQLGLNLHSDGRGFKFIGHTDSEVIGHTFEEKWDEYKTKVIS